MPLSYKQGQFERPITYAVKHKSTDTRMASSSGGMFTALSNSVLQAGGVVYGCAMTQDFMAVHTRAENHAERDLMRQSKYIQSDMRDVFVQVKADLDGGRQVLFSGTSCQVVGLKAFLGHNYENLHTVDVMCLGVPSPLIWKEYLQWQQERNGSEIVGAQFRNKRDFDWNSREETIRFANGKRVDSTIFRTMFYGHCILRPSCYKCPYKDIIHPADMTIADYWGITKLMPEFDDKRGVSLVLINNETGKAMFDAVASQVEAVETRIEDSMQPSLQAPPKEPAARENFWIDALTEPFSVLVRRYGKTKFIIRIKRKIKKLLKR